MGREYNFKTKFVSRSGYPIIKVTFDDVICPLVICSGVWTNLFDYDKYEEIKGHYYHILPVHQKIDFPFDCFKSEGITVDDIYVDNVRCSFAYNLTKGFIEKFNIIEDPEYRPVGLIGSLFLKEENAIIDFESVSFYSYKK